MPDSSDIDNALVAKLASDATLLALVPNGVWMDEADAGLTRFVIVSLVDEQDLPQFGGRAIEDALYLVEARMYWKQNSGAALPPTKAAAARIDVLLENATLTVAGYASMTVHREARVRFTEVDEQDSTIRWFRRGGHYRVQMSVS